MAVFGVDICGEQVLSYFYCQNFVRNLCSVLSFAFPVPAHNPVVIHAAPVVSTHVVAMIGKSHGVSSSRVWLEEVSVGLVRTMGKSSFGK